VDDLKKNKLMVLVITLALLIVTAGCQPANPKMRNLGTQTRVRNQALDNRRMTNNVPLNRNMNTLPYTTNDGLVTRTEPYTRDMLDTNLNTTTPKGTVAPRGTATHEGTARPNTHLSTNVSGTHRADTIARKVANLPEVNNASVVLSDKTAIVGCSIKNNVKGSMTTDLKHRIEKTVKDADKNIQHVSVTADPDLYTRIQTMARDIGTGRPIQGFATEIQEILRRITPAR
jgi:YhcN/YlaJ family sporulation lipoprotein